MQHDREDHLLAELRDLADDTRPDLLHDRIARLSRDETARVVFQLLVIDAARRAADARDDEQPELPADPLVFADALDYAARLSAALGSIDEYAALLAGVFDALSGAEARLLVFERALRTMVERARGRHGGDGA